VSGVAGRVCSSEPAPIWTSASRRVSLKGCPGGLLVEVSDGVCPILENSTACHIIDAKYLVPGPGSVHCLVGWVGFGRIILWLKLDDQLFLSWLFDFSRVSSPFVGSEFAHCSGCFFGGGWCGGCLNINGEFDPGSGRTLAACLTHASRTVRIKLAWSDQWRTGE
jgi:hypothetical protein